MPSPLLTVQFVVVALLAAVGILTLGRWLGSREYRLWSWAWLAWAVGAAALGLCPVLEASAPSLLIGHTIAYAAFGSLLAAGTHLTVKTEEVRLEQIRPLHGTMLGALGLITGLVILWRWPLPRTGVDYSLERHFWSGPWLIGYAFFAIWIIRKHRSRWNIRPPIVLFVLALLLVATTEGVVIGVLFRYEPHLPQTAETLVEFLTCLEPVLAGFLALAMFVMLMDNLVYSLERNVIASSKQTAKLKRLAERDPLTAVLNRHAFYSLMGAARDEKKRPLGGTVAIIDIDNLKPLNDTYGHAAGDVAIRSVAKAVRSIIRAEDLLFRWGGDEFLIILPHVDYEEATERLGKLDNLLMRVTLPGAPQPISISLSVGIAVFSSTVSLEQAIDQADEKMYALKLKKKAG